MKIGTEFLKLASVKLKHIKFNSNFWKLDVNTSNLSIIYLNKRHIYWPHRMGFGCFSLQTQLPSQPSYLPDVQMLYSSDHQEGCQRSLPPDHWTRIALQITMVPNPLVLDSSKMLLTWLTRVFYQFIIISKSAVAHHGAVITPFSALTVSSKFCKALCAILQ